MIYLVFVSILWSLSFSLIKGTLTTVDPTFVGFMRLFISLAVFLPFINIRGISRKLFMHFLLIGAIQYGFMYLAYIYSFQFLKAYEIVILTIFTPIFVIIIYDIWSKKFIAKHWIKAILATFGAAIIVYSDNITIGFWIGILLMQISNIMFALGQVYYKKIIGSEKISNQAGHYSIIYSGAVLVTGFASALTTDFTSLDISRDQILVLIYLGAVASGIGFFLWNYGVTKVEAGSVAVLNNLKIPLGVIFAVIILNEEIELFQLALGSLLIIAALFLNKISNLFKKL